MRIHGPLREAQIDLSTDDGLDRNQTAFLLLTGRTTTDSQRFGTQNPTVGANITTGADVAGQLTRDTLANLMEPYIDDTFHKLTGLNLRLTVGPDGFEGRIRKRISRKLNFQADYLQGFQNNSKADGPVRSPGIRLPRLWSGGRTDHAVFAAGGVRDPAPNSTSNCEFRATTTR